MLRVPDSARAPAYCVRAPGVPAPTNLGLHTAAAYAAGRAAAHDHDDADLVEFARAATAARI